jgi:putative ABC transport system permease protein
MDRGAAVTGISGVYPYYSHMRRMEVEDGSFFTESDESTRSRVAILGADVKKKLFSGENALGEKVRIDGISYVVTGVLKHVIQNGDENMNGKVYIPFSAMSDLSNTYYLNAVAMEYEGDHEKVAQQCAARWPFITISIPRTSAPCLSSTCLPIC